MGWIAPADRPGPRRKPPPSLFNNHRVVGVTDDNQSKTAVQSV
jgi:hypothetical protein